MNKRELTFVSGLYFYTRNGQTTYPEKIILELEKFDIVASFKEDNSHDDVYRIWLKKDFYFYSEPL